jgi:hypothetical protein
MIATKTTRSGLKNDTSILHSTERAGCVHGRGYELLN